LKTSLTLVLYERLFACACNWLPFHSSESGSLFFMRGGPLPTMFPHPYWQIILPARSCIGRSFFPMPVLHVWPVPLKCVSYSYPTPAPILVLRSSEPRKYRASLCIFSLLFLDLMPAPIYERFFRNRFLSTPTGAIFIGFFLEPSARLLRHEGPAFAVFPYVYLLSFFCHSLPQCPQTERDGSDKSP